MLRRDLLDRAAGEPVLHVPDVDAADPAAEAERFAGLIADGGLDLALVGLGGNGHIGMNEPGSGDDSPTRIVTLEETTAANAARYGATSRPTWGITVGMAELMDATELWLLVTGAHKREILGRALVDPIGPQLPCTFLRLHRACTVLADHSAMGRSANAR
jgi:glucosamine-6-phosphate deaminase